MFEVLVWAVGALAGTWVLTWLFIRLALRWQLLDHPNARSSHQVPTPRGGGVAMVLVILGVLAYWLLGSSINEPQLGWPLVVTFIGGGLAIATVGLMDDIFGTGVLLRLAVQVAASSALMAALALSIDKSYIGSLPAVLVLAGTVIGLVWAVNLYNFMDGIDGLAATEALTVLCGAALVLFLQGDRYWSSILAVLTCAVLGFLAWNWPPARIFMGDVASGFLGFLLGGLALVTTAMEKTSLLVWVVLTAAFWSDATVALLRRLWRRERFYEAHRTHAYQIAARRLNAHLPVTLAFFLINVLWLWPMAYWVSSVPQYGTLVALAAVLPLILAARLTGSGDASKS